MPLAQIEGVESVFDRQLKRRRYGKGGQPEFSYPMQV